MDVVEKGGGRRRKATKMYLGVVNVEFSIFIYLWNCSEFSEIYHIQSSEGNHTRDPGPGNSSCVLLKKSKKKYNFLFKVTSEFLCFMWEFFFLKQKNYQIYLPCSS
jgi:hypothetical protein